jgi:hypothetical protein
MNCTFVIQNVNESQNGMSTITLAMTDPGGFAQAGAAPSGTITLIVPTSLVVQFVPNRSTPVAFS